VKDIKLSAEGILTKGIEALRQNDRDIDCLLSPRAEEVIQRLVRYINEIESFNAAYGLVGAADTEELVIKHILDSLAPLGIISRLLAECLLAERLLAERLPTEARAAGRPQIADAGSGAGLPGIPLAVTMPNFYFTLIERMGRRAGFLWNTKASLNLSNIDVEEGELEKTAPGRFHLVTFRAFKPLEPKLLKALFKACAKGGIVAAYKGRREKIEQEIAPLFTTPLFTTPPLATTLENCSWESLPYTVPFLNEERHLLVIKTPKI
jgi:16S rRNA (guanine527-N7)-methyltransferase